MCSSIERFLLKNNQPCFYLDDTAWELFLRLDRPAPDRFRHTRVAQHVKVIEALAGAALDGFGSPKANGDLPLHDLDLMRPSQHFRSVLAADHGSGTD